MVDAGISISDEGWFPSLMSLLDIRDCTSRVEGEKNEGDHIIFFKLNLALKFIIGP